MGSVRSTFWAKEREGSYLPLVGLAAAMMEHRADRVVTIPAFEIDMLCCSIASWILVLIPRQSNRSRGQTDQMIKEKEEKRRGRGNEPVLVVHLVELVDHADTLVSEDEGTTFEGPLASDGIFDHRCRQTHCTRSLSRGVHCPVRRLLYVPSPLSAPSLGLDERRERKRRKGKERRDVLEELGLGGTGITHEEDVDITSDAVVVRSL